MARVAERFEYFSGGFCAAFGKLESGGQCQNPVSRVTNFVSSCITRGAADLFVIPAQAGIQLVDLTGFPPAREREYSGSFKRDVKRAEKRGKDMAALRTVLRLLLTGEPIPAAYKDHSLKGNWKLSVPRRRMAWSAEL